MEIAGYHIYSLDCGTIGLDGGAMFGVVPKTLWNKHNPADELNRITLALRPLLLVGNGRKILVDVGIGDKDNEKFQKIYKIENSQKNVQSELKQLNIEPEEITDVIITHYHFDHAGAVTSHVNDELVLTFPNARHFVQKDNWEQTLNPVAKDRASYIEDNYLPLKGSSQLELIDGTMELFPNFEVIKCNGHTFGLQMVKVSDGAQTLLYGADLIPTTTHIPLFWVMGYDLQPLVTIEEKQHYLPMAAEEGWILAYEHDPFCQASYVVKHKDDYRKGEEVTIS